MTSQDPTLRVSEIFGPTIQGEGALIGQPTVFVRLGGCDYRCSWCDTLHAVESKYRHDWHPMTAAAIMDRVEELSGGEPIMISLSGGNPATQDCSSLITLGKSMGYQFALETQGSVSQDWFSTLDVLTLSPKPPSSDMDTNWAKLEACVQAGAGSSIALKIVIFDDKDYAYARDVERRYPDLSLYLQPGNHTPPAGDEENAKIDIDGIMDRMLWLVDKVNADKWYRVTVLPQLHVLLWGNKKGV